MAPDAPQEIVGELLEGHLIVGGHRTSSPVDLQVEAGHRRVPPGGGQLAVDRTRIRGSVVALAGVLLAAGVLFAT